MGEQPLAGPAELVEYQAAEPLLMTSAAQAAVRSFCRWHIAPSRTETVTMDGSGAQIQPLPTLHLTAVTDLMENGTAVAVDGATVQWSEVGYLWRAAPWTRRLRGITVTITHGYEQIPAEVQGVVLSAAARATASPSGTSEDVGPFRLRLSQNADGSTGGVLLSDAEKDVLWPYRLPEGP